MKAKTCMLMLLVFIFPLVSICHAETAVNREVHQPPYWMKINKKKLEYYNYQEIFPQKIVAALERPVRNPIYLKLLSQQAERFSIRGKVFHLEIDTSSVVDVGAPTANQANTLALIKPNSAKKLLEPLEAVKAPIKGAEIYAALASNLSFDARVSNKRMAPTFRYNDYLFVVLVSHKLKQVQFWKIDARGPKIIFKTSFQNSVRLESKERIPGLEMARTYRGGYERILARTPDRAGYIAIEGFSSLDEAPKTIEPLDGDCLPSSQVVGAQLSTTLDALSHGENPVLHEMLAEDRGEPVALPVLDACPSAEESDTGTDSGGSYTHETSDGGTSIADGAMASYITDIGVSQGGPTGNDNALYGSVSNPFNCFNYCDAATCQGCCAAVHATSMASISVAAGVCHAYADLCPWCQAGCFISEGVSIIALGISWTSCNGNCSVIVPGNASCHFGIQ